VFAWQGRPGLGQEGGEVSAAEAGGKGIAEEVEGGRKVHTGGCFIVAESAEDYGVGREGQGAERLDGAIDPGVEVRLDALFEIEQALGKGIWSGCQGKIWTEVEVGKPGVSAFYFGCKRSHDLRIFVVLRAVSVIRVAQTFVVGTFLAVLPDEDRRPGQHAGHQPPCGLQDQEKEKDPRYER
jgi:hypothetical protein